MFNYSTLSLSQVKGAAPASSASTGQVVPNNFAAGQQVAGNPLAPLMNAQNAGAIGKHLHLGSVTRFISNLSSHLSTISPFHLFQVLLILSLKWESIRMIPITYKT